MCVYLGPSVFLMNYPSEEKDIPLKADSDPARYIQCGATFVSLIQSNPTTYVLCCELCRKRESLGSMKESVLYSEVSFVQR